MTNVSKKPIKVEVLKKISNRFIKIISELNNHNNTKLFLEDFLTESEKIMLFKRLAIIFMLSQNISLGVIMRILNVSSATVRKIAIILDRGGYKNIITEIKKEKIKKSFQIELEVLLRAGMPKYGRGRWNFLKKI